MTISDLNIQDDKMIISCEVGIYVPDSRQFRRALQYGFDETTLRVYGKQLIFIYQTPKLLSNKLTIYFKLMQGLSE